MSFIRKCQVEIPNFRRSPSDWRDAICWQSNLWGGVMVQNRLIARILLGLLASGLSACDANSENRKQATSAPSNVGESTGVKGDVIDQANLEGFGLQDGEATAQRVAKASKDMRIFKIVLKYSDARPITGAKVSLLGSASKFEEPAQALIGEEGAQQPQRGKPLLPPGVDIHIYAGLYALRVLHGHSNVFEIAVNPLKQGVNIQSYAVAVSDVKELHGGVLIVPIDGVSKAAGDGFSVSQDVVVPLGAPPPACVEGAMQIFADTGRFAAGTNGQSCVQGVGELPQPALIPQGEISGLEAEVQSLGLPVVDSKMKIDQIACAGDPVSCVAKYGVSGTPVSKELSQSFSKFLGDTYPGMEFDNIVCGPLSASSAAALIPGKDFKCSAQIVPKKS